MEWTYKSSKLKKVLEDPKLLQRHYGAEQAKKIGLRMDQLNAAINLDDVAKLPQTGLHTLTGDRKGQLAIYIKQPYRLILEPLNGNIADYKTITKVQINEIVVDYHRS